MVRGTTALFAAAALLLAGTALAQHGSAPPGTSMGVPGSNDANARPLEMGAHDSSSLTSTVDQLQHGVQRADADRAAAIARSGGRAVPAKPGDIVAAATVFDLSGQTVGTIDAVDPDGAIVETVAGKVKVPLSAFGKNRNGLLIGVSKKDFEMLVTKANAAPTG
ncbi:MAG TPA: hypothetical protein VH331_06920 [Allosphingosinicella sp.]|jgi:hypothetical protein|nr:hypothetical protein [Allosphingosinicella sp.]